MFIKIVKKTSKWTLYFLLIPISYLLISWVLTIITVDKKDKIGIADKSIFLSTNGVHLDIVIPKNNIDSTLLAGINLKTSNNFLSFGWGDENFYLNTPTWGDLTFKNAIKAAFLKSSTLIHVTRYNRKQNDWVEIKVNQNELQLLISYILNSFLLNDLNKKILLENKGYSSNDDFYKAKGSYSCFNTCNSWVNTGFKISGLKSCLWTPFDFGLLNKHEVK